MADHTRARLGILMLDSRFPRPEGDVGNPATWDFPVRYGVVPGATPEAIVRTDPAPFVDAFIAAGRALVGEGCAGIATTCGFLAVMRPQLSAALGVPVAASALEQAAQITAMLPPDRKIGVLTISKASLTPAHLSTAGVPVGTVIAGVEDTEFAASILGNQASLDEALARRELVQAARQMVGADPAVGAVLLECTNMVPHAGAIAQATGKPVFSIYTYLNWFHESLAPSAFDKH